MQGLELIKEIVHKGSIAEKLELYGFDSKTPRDKIKKKFKIFARANYPRYFEHKSAPFQDSMIDDMIASYYGDNILSIGFRGCAKTSILKLFTTFVLLNDRDHYRKYIKVLSRESGNSKQITTDVYNLIVEVIDIYGDVFEKDGDKKHEETMGGFTMKCQVKYRAGTVGQTQRGHVQDAYRPDWLQFEDIEDVDSIKSALVTEGIIKRCGEAINGMKLIVGSYYINANYISDMGVIEWFKQKPSVKTIIVPLLTDDKDDSSVTWDVITPEDVRKIRKDCEVDPNGDFYGEFMCDPTNKKNKFFNIDKINEDLKKCTEPRKVGQFKYWSEYKPNHRYGIGTDHSEGVGLDSNTLALFDFNTGELLVTYANNEIAPDMAIHEFVKLAGEYGNPIFAPEVNNTCGGTARTTLKTLMYPNVYIKQDDSKVSNPQTNKIGWETNSQTKYTMLFEFKTDYNDGLIKIYDKNVLAEMKAYTNNDLQEKTAGLITRHFDLLMACCIGYQMRKHSQVKKSNYKKAYQNYIES